MLLIYSALPVGGIETFFCRLAKERGSQNLQTSVLLLSQATESDKELLAEIKRYCNVYFYNDLFKGPRILGSLKIPRTGLPLVLPMRMNILSSILLDVSQIHVTNGVCALLAKRIVDTSGVKIPITVGVYHSQEFAWGLHLPYFEVVNRNFVLGAISSKNLFCFYESTKNYIKRKTGFAIQDAKTFRLGVISSAKLYDGMNYEESRSLRICMVGRLVDFKKYNTWMPKVVYELLQMNIDVLLDIYGDGPMLEEIQSEIDSLALSDRVVLKGVLKYSKFNEVVSGYNLFLGSGTSVIQAASLGVPSIIGIESNPYPTTYGFFSNFYQDEYHHPDLGYEKVSVRDLILEYTNLDAESRKHLSKSHARAAQLFSMEHCSVNFETDLSCDLKSFTYSPVRYIFSRFISFSLIKLMGKSIYDRAI